MAQVRRYTPSGMVTGPGVTTEYAMIVARAHPRRRERVGDIIMCGTGDGGKMRQDLGMKVWDGWVPIERVILPWIISGRFDLAEEAEVTAPREGEGWETW